MKEILDRIKVLEKRREKINKEISTLKDVVKESCNHEILDTVVDYLEGSYFNKSETITKVVCQNPLCKKELSRDVTYGQYS